MQPTEPVNLLLILAPDFILVISGCLIRFCELRVGEVSLRARLWRGLSRLSLVGVGLPYAAAPYWLSGGGYLVGFGRGICLFFCVWAFVLSSLRVGWFARLISGLSGWSVRGDEMGVDICSWESISIVYIQGVEYYQVLFLFLSWMYQFFYFSSISFIYVYIHISGWVGHRVLGVTSY